MTPSSLEEAVAKAIQTAVDNWTPYTGLSVAQTATRAALAVVREKMPVVAWTPQHHLDDMASGKSVFLRGYVKVGDPDPGPWVPLIAASPLGGDKP